MNSCATPLCNINSSHKNVVMCVLVLSAVSRVSEEEEEDYDYSPDEDEWRKVNKVIFFFHFIHYFSVCLQSK